MTTSPAPVGEAPPRRAPRPKKNDRAFLVMLIILALAAASWFLTSKFMAMSQVQDCVMSGRKNCVQVDDPSPR